MEQNVEVKETQPKKKRSWIFTLFACIATGVIVFLAMNIGENLGKTVDPKTDKSSNKEVVCEEKECDCKEENTTTETNSNSNTTTETNSNSNTTTNSDSNTVVQTKVSNVIEDKNGVPYVNIKGLESVNNAISTSYNKIKDIKEHRLSYSYSVRNNVLVLVVDYSYPVAMDATIWTEVYYIDLATNKQISANEAITKLNVNKAELIEQLNKAGYTESKEIPSDLIIVPAGDQEVILPEGLGASPFINGRADN